VRKVNVLEFVSLDGVIQAPTGPEEDTSGGFAYGGWKSPHADAVSGTAMRKQMNMPSDLLLGRIPLSSGMATRVVCPASRRLLGERRDKPACCRG
jgi:hypothetical protein